MTDTGGVLVELESRREKCLALAAIFDKPRYYTDVRGVKYLVPATDKDHLIATALRAYADAGPRSDVP